MLKSFPEPEEPFVPLKNLKNAGCLLIDFHWLRNSKIAAEEANRLKIPVVGEVDGKINKNTEEILRRIDYIIAAENCALSLDAGKDYRQACKILREQGMFFTEHSVLAL